MSHAARAAVGILGGMGPAATADLFQKVIAATPARRDQDHLRILVDCHPQIPDRVTFLRGEGPDPTPALMETARNLERAGAGLIIIACNTAHLFYEAIQAAVAVPVLHMMRETAADLTGRFTTVGLVATTGTIQGGLYHRELERAGIGILTPSAADQAELMEALFAVKAGRIDAARPVVVRIARALAEQGAEAVIAGCTEVPLVLTQQDLSVPLADATQSLAKAAVRRAKEGPTHA
jgi:aspartate racemase